MFATGVPRCPVLLFKTYLAYRPDEMSPFQSPIIKKNPEKRSVAQETEDFFMKNMALEAELDVVYRKLPTTRLEKRLRTS